MTKLYCFDDEPCNAEWELDDKIHIAIKDNTVMMESDSSVKWKIPIVYNSNDSKGQKCNIEGEARKKTTFIKSDNAIIPNSEAKCKQIIC